MIIDVCHLAGARLLAGRGPARKVLGRLIAEASNPEAPEIWLLDYLAAELVTGSFFAETFIGFSKHVRTSLPNIYPVVAVREERSIQELEFVAGSAREVIPTCAGLERGRLKAFRLVGSLDSHQDETLTTVMRLGEATAKELAESTRNTSGSIGVTAWHNRLAALARKGLLIEKNEGRQKVYMALGRGASSGR